MKDSYSRFGDLVSFDITYNILRNVAQDNRRFRVGVFTVQDTNVRVLFAGLAIIADETAYTLSRMFYLLFDIHGKTPSTLVTDGQHSI